MSKRLRHQSNDEINENQKIGIERPDAITKMLQSNQKRLLSMLQLDSNQGEELQNDNADNTSEISSDNSKEDEVLLPEESKRAVVSATPKMKEVVIPVYIKSKPRRRNLPSVFTRYAFLNYMNDISKRILHYFKFEDI